MQGHLLQLPPTLLALHGVPRPDHYEMHALDELLVESASAVPACVTRGAVADSLLA